MYKQWNIVRVQEEQQQQEQQFSNFKDRRGNLAVKKSQIYQNCPEYPNNKWNKYQHCDFRTNFLYWIFEVSLHFWFFYLTGAMNALLVLNILRFFGDNFWLALDLAKFCAIWRVVCDRDMGPPQSFFCLVFTFNGFLICQKAPIPTDRIFAL